MRFSHEELEFFYHDADRADLDVDVGAGQYKPYSVAKSEATRDSLIW